VSGARRLAVVEVLGALAVGLVASASAAAPAKAKAANVAFVLLGEAKLPKGEAIERAFAAFALDDQRLHFRADKPRADGALELALGGAGPVFVKLVATPVPNGEADDAVRFSVSALGGRWKLPPHAAHLVVSSLEGPRSEEALSAFTSLVAAVARASSAVGIYWGGAGATHDPRFFDEIARAKDTPSRLVLWTGVSIAKEADGRLSLLSLGMRQLDLPELWLVFPRAKSDDAINTLLELLGPVVEAGHAPPDGGAVGREHLIARDVPSPVDGKAKVWRVELK
jgi:hypothetical protein